MPDVRNPDTKTARPGRPGETLRLAREETIVEARPKPGVPSADEMFLSPRVLDAGAFARYAEMLRSLIGDARQGARDLQDFAADADELTARCERSGDQLKARLEAGARIIKLVDERADRAERLLETARSALPTEEALKAQIEPALKAALQSAEQRAAQVAAESEQRLRSAAADIERRLAAMTARAAEQTERLERAGETLDQRLGAIETRLTELGANAERTAAEQESRVNRAVQSARAELDPVLQRAAETTVGVDNTLEAAWKRADERATNIADRVAPLQAACDAVLERLGLSDADSDPSRSVLHRLESMVERSEKSMGGADRVLYQITELTKQAEGVKTRFGSWLLEAASQLDVLEARRDKLTGPLADAAEKIARVSPHLNDDLEAASLKLDQLQTEQAILREAIGASMTLAKQSGERLNNQAAQMRALIDGAMHGLTQRVEEAGMWLGQLITRAEAAGGVTHHAPPPQAPAVETIIEQAIEQAAEISQPEATTFEPIHAQPIQAEPIATDPSPHQAIEHEPQPAPAAWMPTESHEPTVPPKQEAHTMSPTQTQNEQVTQSRTDETAARYGLPTPPSLPIDAVSFDGAEIVYGQPDEDQQPQSAD